VKNGLVNIEIV